MKKTWKSGMILLGWKMSLLFLSILLITGLTACEQAEKAMDEMTQTAEQTVDTVKDKAATMLDDTEKEENEEESAEKEDEEKDED